LHFPSFSVAKESDAQGKSHAKVSDKNSIPIQDNTTRRKKIEKEKPQGAYVLNLSSPSFPESSASCAYYCYVLSCAWTIPVFTLGLLVKIQQQKRWRSEQRQRFLCCTHTEGSSICIRFCSKHTKFTAAVLRRRPFTSRRRDDEDHETVLAPYPI
jgi:hypothetical protein